jgi:hypothetical protein
MSMMIPALAFSAFLMEGTYGHRRGPSLSHFIGDSQLDALAFADDKNRTAASCTRYRHPSRRHFRLFTRLNPDRPAMLINAILDDG